LSFQKTKVKQALQLVYDEQKQAKPKEDRYKLTKSELADWVETIQRRVRNLCRVVSQGMLKSPSALWVRQLPWHPSGGAESEGALRSEVTGKDQKTGVGGKSLDIEEGTVAGLEGKQVKAMKAMKAKKFGMSMGDECKGDRGGSVKAAESSSSPGRRLRRKSADSSKQYEFGFLKEMMLPFRCRMGSSYKETGLPIEIGTDAKDNDFVIAKWADGSEHILDGVTVADVKAVQGLGHTGWHLRCVSLQRCM
jgi:hypothetical protein